MISFATVLGELGTVGGHGHGNNFQEGIETRRFVHGSLGVDSEPSSWHECAGVANKQSVDTFCVLPSFFGGGGGGHELARVRE